MDYTNIAAHLISPLSVDTNIDYTMDLAKFPGLNDPESMKQLALLPSSTSCSIDSPRVCKLCGNLIPYETDDSVQCGFCVYYGLLDIDSKIEEETGELFSLIASCDINTDSESSNSSNDVQSVFEDIIDSTSSQVYTASISQLASSTFVQLSLLSPLPSPHLDSILVMATSETNNAVNCEREVPSVNEMDVTFDEFCVDTTCVLEDLVDEDDNVVTFSPAGFDTSRRKRKHSSESDNTLRKRSKSFDEIEDIFMNCSVNFGHFNSVYSNDRHEVMTRFS